MRLSPRPLRVVSLLLLLTSLLLGPARTSSAAGPSAAPAADPAFDKIWSRTDQLVRAQNVERSWIWGEYPFARVAEPFAEAAGGTRLVEYFDKSRMEINDPSVDRNSEWFVTNGLLVKELMTGRIVRGLGENDVETRDPAAIPVAGDAVAANRAPTYAVLGRVASVAGDANKAPNRVGKFVSETLAEDGTPGTNAALGTTPTRLGTYVTESSHNIPDVFWNFLNIKGQFLNSKFLQSGPLFNWVYVMGYPITEPYWIKVNIGGTERDIMVQAFERRILTYNPANAPAWQVEMGNVGRAYYDWRYGAEGTGAVARPAIATRIVIPQAKVDSTIVPTYVEGQEWQVATYAVGWLFGSSTPGQQGNTVLSGHNNAFGEVFRYLDQLRVGDEFTIYTSDDVAHKYSVSEVTRVKEAGVSLTQQKENARYMQNTDDERVTLISCWPYTANTHRLIVVARPVDE